MCEKKNRGEKANLRPVRLPKGKMFYIDRGLKNVERKNAELREASMKGGGGSGLMRKQRMKEKPRNLHLEAQGLGKRNRRTRKRRKNDLGARGDRLDLEKGDALFSLDLRYGPGGRGGKKGSTRGMRLILGRI